MTTFVTPLIFCHRSIDSPHFSIAIMRESESQEPRQLGTIELATAQILASQSPGQKKGVYDVLVAAPPFDHHQNVIDMSMICMRTNVKDAEVPLELSVSVFTDVTTLGRRCQSTTSHCPLITPQLTYMVTSTLHSFYDKCWLARVQQIPAYSPSFMRRSFFSRIPT